MIELASVCVGVYQIIYDAKRKTPFIIFSASFLFVVVLPSFVVVGPSGEYGRVAFEEGVLYVLLFQATYGLFSFFLQRSDLSDIWLLSEKTDICKGLKWPYVGLVSLSIGLFVYGISGFDLSRLLRLSWWDVVHSNSLFTLLASYLIYSASSVLLIQRSLRSKSLALAAFLFIVFSVFILKTRGYLISLLAPVCLYYLFDSSRKSGSKVFLFLFFSAVSIIFFVLARMIRHGGDLSSLSTADAADFYALLESAVGDGSELMLVKAFYYFVETGIDALPEGFGDYLTLKRVLFFFLPTGLFDIKPVEFSYIMHEAYYGPSKTEGLSMHPTIIGDAFGNGGLVGVVIYPVLLVLVFSCIEKVLLRSRLSITLVGPSCLLAMYIARGAVYNGFVFFVGSSVLITILFLMKKNS